MYLNEIESAVYWVHKYPMYSSNWWFHEIQRVHAVRKWRLTNKLSLVK